ncbi:MAG: TRCF domain-containing protein, partial [Spirochaetales bacterium]
MYGISQLYQLRGRVGRSDRLAYAYLLYPDQRVLSEIAMKRLQIISDFTELGSGFKIALKDLEVRGAGNLLGREQSGDILSVGFDLYLKLLDEAIRRIDEESEGEDEEVYLELQYSGFIPDSYVAEPAEKMELYKRIASISTEEELHNVSGEIQDRFGPMPDEVHSLLSLAEIRILCKLLHVVSLKERRSELEVQFGKVAHISADRVLSLIQSSGGSVHLDAKRPNVLLLDTKSVGLKEKSEFIRGRLSTLIS